ncbi:MAG: hypothetical protein ACR2HS_06365, partial [Gammaproteobacteria bacterium]
MFYKNFSIKILFKFIKIFAYELIIIKFNWALATNLVVTGTGSYSSEINISTTTDSDVTGNALIVYDNAPVTSVISLTSTNYTSASLSNARPMDLRTIGSLYSPAILIPPLISGKNGIGLLNRGILGGNAAAATDTAGIFKIPSGTVTGDIYINNQGTINRKIFSHDSIDSIYIGNLYITNSGSINGSIPIDNENLNYLGMLNLQIMDSSVINGKIIGPFAGNNILDIGVVGDVNTAAQYTTQQLIKNMKTIRVNYTKGNSFTIVNRITGVDNTFSTSPYT